MRYNANLCIFCINEKQKQSPKEKTFHQESFKQIWILLLINGFHSPGVPNNAKPKINKIHSNTTVPKMKSSNSCLHNSDVWSGVVRVTACCRKPSIHPSKRSLRRVEFADIHEVDISR